MEIGVTIRQPQNLFDKRIPSFDRPVGDTLSIVDTEGIHNLGFPVRESGSERFELVDTGDTKFIDDLTQSVVGSRKISVRRVVEILVSMIELMSFLKIRIKGQHHIQHLVLRDIAMKVLVHTETVIDLRRIKELIYVYMLVLYYALSCKRNTGIIFLNLNILSKL